MPLKVVKRKAKAVFSDDDTWVDADSRPGKRTRVSALTVDGDEKKSTPGTSNQVQSWADWQPKLNDKERKDKREYSENFRRNTDRSREIVHTQLSRATEDLINAQKNQAELLEKAYSDLQPASKAGSQMNAARSVHEHSLFATGQNLFRACHSLVATHEQANGKTLAQACEQTSAIRTQWQADFLQMKKAMLHGEQYGQKLVGCQVDLWGGHECRDQLLTPPWESLKDAGKVALDMHQKSMDRLLNGSRTWGEQAFAYVERLVGIVAASEAQRES